jgi:hypothetical protein
MESIRIETGVKTLMVNDDPTRVISFNPGDVAFAERFYQLLKDFEVKQVEYQKRADELDARQGVDEFGAPANLADGIALMRDICNFLRERIDHLFGTGTSKAAFGDAMSLEMFEQFFAGIMPYIQKARSAKLEKYNQPTPSKKGRAVMK